MSVLSAAVIILSIIISLYYAARLKLDDSVYFLIYALGGRYALSFVHEFSFSPALAGQSLNSLFSISVVLLGLMFFIRFYVNLKYINSVGVLILVAFTSSFINSTLGEFLQEFTKWGYFFSLTLSIYLLMKKHSGEVILKVIAPIFIGVVISQLLSIVLNTPKMTEQILSDSNSASYIGGYGHESAFSFILLTVGVLILQASKYWNKSSTAFFCLTVLFILIVFANYRTSLMAYLVLFIMYIIYFIGRKQVPVKIISYSIAILVGFLVTTLFLNEITSRFSDIGDLFTKLDFKLILDPSTFTVEEKRLLSSRLYIWNLYYFEYKSFPLINLIFGSGPGSWKQYFDLYAHNSFVAYLFDMGIVGVLCLIVFYLQIYFTLFFRKLCNAHMQGAFFSFIVLNLATMPLWNIEGLILLAFIVGISMYNLENERGHDKR
ncbi:O-antigen ligase family protein [Vibrio sp. WJH972]